MSGEWKTRITKIQSAKPQGSNDGEACLVLIYPPGADLGKRFPLDRQEFVLGRGTDCDIQVDRDSVSRRHAKVFLRDGTTWVVQDLGSTNGSYVNDESIQQAPLRDGDFLKIGAAIFKFLTGANVEMSYHEEIYRMTIVDGLTGVHNKRYFLEFLDREISGAARYLMPVSLVLFDVDHFKHVNDTHGHLAGDAVLKELARRLKPRMRREDLLARYGGEEFACILTKTGLNGALIFAEHVRNMIGGMPFQYDGKQLVVTVSLGVAEFEGSKAIPPDELIKVADERIYAAKNAGRNRVMGPP